MLLPRSTQFTSSFSSPSKMKLRKFSITTSFVSVCWFASLIAICLFTFLYIHPRDTDNCLSTLGANSTPTAIGVEVPRLNDSTVIELQESSQALVNDSTVIELIDSTVAELNKTSQVPQKEEPAAKLSDSNSIVVEVTEKIPRRIEEETDQEYDTIPPIDVFWNPPQNCSKEERVSWLKEKFEESKLIKSTSRTQYFDEKIQSFFNPRGNNDVNYCRVRIFLTWTYPSSLFGKRELLVLESIIRAHPDGCVVILSRTMDSNPGRSVLRPILDLGCRVLTLAPDYHYVFSDTPAQGWFERLESGEVDPGIVPITINLSNLLRLAVLYKYGGVYLDNDIILIKPVSHLRNTIGIQSVDHKTGSWSEMSNAVLIFDKGHPLLWKFMEEFAWSFDGFRWAYNGPGLATRVVSKTLNDSNYQFNIIAPLAFYPIDWVRINRLFVANNDWAEGKLGSILGESYGIHLWNRQSRDLKIMQMSIIHKLISDHCIVCQNIHDS